MLQRVTHLQYTRRAAYGPGPGGGSEAGTRASDPPAAGRRNPTAACRAAWAGEPGGRPSRAGRPAWPQPGGQRRRRNAGSSRDISTCLLPQSLGGVTAPEPALFCTLSVPRPDDKQYSGSNSFQAVGIVTKSFISKSFAHFSVF